MSVADTSGLLAFFNRREPSHRRVAEIVAAERDRLIVSPYVVAELDYLILTRLGVSAEIEVLRGLSGGAYDLGHISAEDIASATAVVEKYSDRKVGIPDASLVVLASSHRTRSILTLDHRHFGALRPLDGGKFNLLPRASEV